MYDKNFTINNNLIPSAPVGSTHSNNIGIFTTNAQSRNTNFQFKTFQNASLADSTSTNS